MPKINLLQQATTELGGGKSKSISTQTTQLIIAVVIVLVVVVAFVIVDWTITSNNNEKVKNELAQERKVADELNALKAQADELQRKISLVDNRVKVIKQLRAEQRGPVAVLSRINERIPIGVNLDSITQRATLITIIGSSTSDALINGFVKDLEFSGGLFTNLSPKQELVAPTSTAEQYYKFTVTCTYNPPVAAQTGDATQTASNTGVR